MLIMTAGSAQAAPFNAVGKNPNIVEYHPEGSHAIIGLRGSPGLFHAEGKDLVMAAGASGNFQQWYENGIGYHSVWLHVGDGTSCPNSFVLIVDARNDANDPTRDTWGYHLELGNYCVSTNAYLKGE